MGHKLRCIYCCADVNDDLEEILTCIKNCPNCLSDLKMNGNWTGIGHNIMNYVIKHYGIETVRLTYEKIRFQEI